MNTLRVRALQWLAITPWLAFPNILAQNYDAPLAAAEGYNLMVFQGATLANTDSEGRVAVGGNATFTNYSVASSLGGVPSVGNALVVGGDLSYNGGEVHYGNVVYGGTLNAAPSVPNGSISRGASLDFNSLRNQLADSSLLLSQVVANGSVADDGGRIVLTGTHAELNVFEIPSSLFSGAWGISIDAPSGSTVLVNIDGAINDIEYVDYRLVDSDGLGSTDSRHILLNFHETSQLSIAGVGVFGSVLAPNADVSFNWAQIDGQLIANSLDGTGEVHNKGFAGSFAAAATLVPEPSSLLLWGSGVLAACLRRRR